GDPAPEAWMIERAAPMSRTRLDDGREMVSLVAPYRPDHGQLIDHAANVRKPVGDRDARLPIPRECAQTGNHGPSHLGLVIAEPDDIDQLPRPLVVLRVEGVDMADATAHEQRDDRRRSGPEVRTKRGVADLAGLCPESAHGDAKEAAAALMQEAAPVDPA